MPLPPKGLSLRLIVFAQPKHPASDHVEALKQEGSRKTAPDQFVGEGLLRLCRAYPSESLDQFFLGHIPSRQFCTQKTASAVLPLLRRTSHSAIFSHNLRRRRILRALTTFVH